MKRKINQKSPKKPSKHKTYPDRPSNTKTWKEIEGCPFPDRLEAELPTTEDNPLDPTNITLSCQLSPLDR
jgi:hypothetical protein